MRIVLVYCCLGILFQVASSGSILCSKDGLSSKPRDLERLQSDKNGNCLSIDDHECAAQAVNSEQRVCERVGGKPVTLVSTEPGGIAIGAFSEDPEVSEPAQPDSYFNRACDEYRRGRVEKALRLFYAHCLVVEEGEANEKLCSFLRYYHPKVVKPDDLRTRSEGSSRVLPKLTTNLTFAVGVNMDLKSKAKSVMPIGTFQLGERPPQPADTRLLDFEDLTGDFGSALVLAIDQRRAEGAFGKLFRGISSVETTKYRGTVQAEVGKNEWQKKSLRDIERIENNQRVIDDWNARGIEIGPGSSQSEWNDFIFNGPGSLDFKGEQIDNFDDIGSWKWLAQRGVVTKPGESMTDGLRYLGVGSSDQLIKAAINQKADGLFIFDIKSTKEASRLSEEGTVIASLFRLRFLLPNGKVVALSKSLKNTDVERNLLKEYARFSTDRSNAEKFAQASPQAVVREQIEQVFSHLDSTLDLGDVPIMSEKAAMRYLHSKIHSEADPLEVMAIARLFKLRGFITSEKQSMVYQIVLEGNEGESLSLGSMADRELVLRLRFPDLHHDDGLTNSKSQPTLDSN